MMASSLHYQVYEVKVLLCQNFDGAVEVHDGDLQGVGIRAARRALVLRQPPEPREDLFQLFPDVAGGVVAHL